MKSHSLPHISAILLLLTLLSLLWVACDAQTPDQTAQIQQTSLRTIKQYTLDKANQLKTNATTLKNSSTSYYNLAKAANFDYANLAKGQQAQVLTLLNQARNALLTAFPTYNQMQGIVAVIPSLQEYDIILASGVAGSGSAASDNISGSQQGTIVPFDLTLPDGRVLTAPGNLFDVLENSLWGLLRAYQTKVPFDYHTKYQNIGNTLPDANILISSATAMDKYTSQLLTAIQKWQPTLTEVFNTLTTNLASVQNMYASWEITLFVATPAVKQFDMSVRSHLTDFIDNIAGWQKIYAALSPLARTADSAQDAQITKGLDDLKKYVSDIDNHYMQNPQSKDFDLIHVDLLKTETANRANAVHDQLVRVAAKLKVVIQQ
ncbi:MAG TPA: imelysin family protein [Ktedonobacteraceae bacterium]|nr:imelysin family protein [Ktedonobacteraceae bacterium]